MALLRSLTSTSRRTGIALACLTAVISGFAVFLNGYAVRAWTEISDATTYTTMKNTVAALILLGVVTLRTRAAPASTRKRPVGKAWLGLAFIATAGGALSFVLFFEGLARATSVSAAFIHKTLIIWVAILAVGILRERIRPIHLFAIGLLIAGQVVLAGGVGGIRFGSGETMILVATLLWAIEVVVAKRLLAGISPSTIAVARMAGGATILLSYLALSGGFAGLSGLTLSHVGWVALTGVVLSGYVGTWFAALSRAPAVDVTAVLVGGALITALLRTGIQGVALPAPAGLGLVTAGVVAVVIVSWRTRSDHILQ